MGTLFARSALHERKRALAKTLCYRALMVLITICVAWVVVGDVSDAVNIGLVANVVKTATYYGYERLWDHVSWGVIAAD
jgi:uncharacterized membrane protein